MIKWSANVLCQTLSGVHSNVAAVILMKQFKQDNRQIQKINREKSIQVKPSTNYGIQN